MPLTNQLTPRFELPVTVATKDWLLPNWTVVALGATTTVTIGRGAMSVTVACANEAGLATEIACTVTVLEAGITAGAVYNPLASIVPTAGEPPRMLLTAHVTAG